MNLKTLGMWFFILLCCSLILISYFYNNNYSFDIYIFWVALIVVMLINIGIKKS